MIPAYFILYTSEVFYCLIFKIVVDSISFNYTEGMENSVLECIKENSNEDPYHIKTPLISIPLQVKTNFKGIQL